MLEPSRGLKSQIERCHICGNSGELLTYYRSKDPNDRILVCNTCYQILQGFIPFDRIEPNPYQPRRVFEKLDELAESIKQQGLIEKVLLRPNPVKQGYFQIAHGERRTRACRDILKWKGFIIGEHCEVKSLTDEQMADIALTENIQRQDLNPIEEAEGFRIQIEVFGKTQEEIAKKIGKSKAYVSLRLQLLKLPDEVKSLVYARKLSTTHLEELIRLNDPKKQVELAKIIVKGGLSTRQTKELVDSMLSSHKLISISELQTRSSDSFICKLKKLMNIKGPCNKCKISPVCNDILKLIEGRV